MRILALDPGATTGWATFTKPNVNREGYKSGQIKSDNVWGLLLSAQTLDSYELTIVCERFVYRRLPKVVLTPVEVIGVVKEWARQNKVDIHWQTPSQVMNFFTNERLQKIGVYRPGKPHAMDAMRHLLYYMWFTLKLEEEVDWNRLR